MTALFRAFVAGIPAPQGSKSPRPGWKYCRSCGASRDNKRPDPGCKKCGGTGRQCFCAMVEASFRTEIWREAIATSAISQRTERIRERTPLQLVAVFTFQRPKSHFAAQGLSAKGREFPYPTGQTVGDVDKLARALGDGLVRARVLDDDRHFVRDIVDKLWTIGDPGVYVEVGPREKIAADPVDTLLAAYGMVERELGTVVSLAAEVLARDQTDDVS